MSVMTEVCTWIAKNPRTQFRTRDVVAMTGLATDQVSNALSRLADTGALQIVEANHGRGGNLFAVAQLEQIRLKSFAAGAPEVVAAQVDGELPGESGQDLLTYALDHDGDLQIIQPDGEAFTIDNENARRLVAFVALQASAILMAGRQ